jgi:FdhD protein
MLVTSGRVSHEMVVKASHLGIPLIASLTSPTNLAVQASEQAGITLVGYLRSKTFEVYTHPERLQIPDSADSGSATTGQA